MEGVGGRRGTVGSFPIYEGPLPAVIYQTPTVHVIRVSLLPPHNDPTNFSGKATGTQKP